MAFLEAKPIAEGAHTLANNVANKAEEERELYEKRRKEKIRKAWMSAPVAVIGWPLVFGIPSFIGGGIAFCIVEGRTIMPKWYAVGIFCSGAIAGLIFGIYKIWKELQ